MTDTYIEIRQSGPDIPDAVYPLVLVDIKGDPENPGQPKHIVPEKGPNAGKDLYFWDWQFAIDQPGHPLDGFELEYGTSLATGPRSKMFPLLVALQNGIRPQVGQKLAMSLLKGRRVLGTVQHDEAGVSRIVSFSAMPAGMQQQSFAAATGAPVATAAIDPTQPGPAVPPAQPAPAVTQPGWQPPMQQIVPPQPVGTAAPLQPAAAPASDDLPF